MVDYFLYVDDLRYNGPIDVIHPLTKMSDWFDISSGVPIRLVREHPLLPWDRDGLSSNKGITVDDVLHLDLPNASGVWDWFYLSMYVPMHDVRINTDQPWNLLGLSNNKELTVDDILNLTLKNATREWKNTSISSSISIVEVRDNPDYKWDLFWLCNNKDITMDDVSRFNLHNWYGLSFSLDMKEILVNISEGWDREGLSQNKDISVRIMEMMDEEEETYDDWHPYYMSKYILPQDVIDYPDMIWHMERLRYNDKLTVDHLISGDIKCDWYSVSRNTDIEFIRANTKYPWCKDGLIKNEGVTLNDLKMFNII